MNQRKNLWMAMTILSLGAIAPGCGTQPNEALGLLCAKSQAATKFCVRSNLSPEGPWNEAMAGGGLPIQMWAERPDAMTLDDLVTSPDNLRAWYADIDTLLAFVRDTKKNAESYKASMNGLMGHLLEEARDRQTALLAQPSIDAVGNFKTAVVDKANAEKSPIVASIANDKQAMTVVQAVFDLAKSKAASLSSAYTGVASQFTAYRATEAAETQAYVALAQQASQSTLVTLPDVEHAILLAGQAASAKPNDLSVAAMKLAAQIQVFDVDPELAFTAQQSDFLATHGAVRPDMTSSALRSLNAMLGYIQHRVARSDAVAASLLHGVATREQALLLLNEGSSSAKSTGPYGSTPVSQAARDAIAQTLLLRASTTFSDAATSRLAAVAGDLPASKTLKLPYLARRYDQLTTLLQMEPLCDPSSSSWRESGCVLLRKNFSAAQASRMTDLPALIAAGISLMRQKGVDAVLLDASQAKLDVGDVKGAALLHDAAVRGTEGT